MFCGFADPSINSNAKKPNPNLSVLEFLNSKPAYQGRVVAAFRTWDVFPFIFRSKQNGLKVHAAWQPVEDAPLTDRQRMMNEMLSLLPHYWADNTFDIVSMEYARVLPSPTSCACGWYIGLGESDEWGHGRRYDLYLDSAHNADRFLGEVVATVAKNARAPGQRHPCWSPPTTAEAIRG